MRLWTGRPGPPPGRRERAPRHRRRACLGDPAKTPVAPRRPPRSPGRARPEPRPGTEKQTGSRPEPQMPDLTRRGRGPEAPGLDRAHQLAPRVRAPRRHGTPPGPGAGTSRVPPGPPWPAAQISGARVPALPGAAARTAQHEGPWFGGRARARRLGASSRARAARPRLFLRRALALRARPRGARPPAPFSAAPCWRVAPTHDGQYGSLGRRAVPREGRAGAVAPRKRSLRTPSRQGVRLDRAPSGAGRRRGDGSSAAHAARCGAGGGNGAPRAKRRPRRDAAASF
jgi:hypothetical protein